MERTLGIDVIDPTFHLSRSTRRADMIRLMHERWIQQAKCVTHVLDPDAFYATTRTKRGAVKAALAMCAVCPVRRECLQNALDNRDPWGIWGGSTERQRARMRRNA